MEREREIEREIYIEREGERDRGERERERGVMKQKARGERANYCACVWGNGFR